MGFRFRKSFNFGGFRLNLSKSGIGYSFGIPGIRYTKLCNGRNRRTLSLPRTGLSYITESSNKNGHNEYISEYIECNTNLQYSANTVTTFNSPQDNIIIEQIKNCQFRNNVYISCLVALLILPILLKNIILYSIPLALIVIKKCCTKFFSFELTNFNQCSSDEYSLLNTLLHVASLNNKIFFIEATKNNDDYKYNAGVKTILTRHNVTLMPRMPKFVMLDFLPYELSFKNTKLYFLPKKILLYNDAKISFINYSDIVCNFYHTCFIEEQIVPTDARIVKYTWEYLNKDGTPDRRFSSNKKLPVCKYGEIHVQSQNGFNAKFLVSNDNSLDTMNKIYCILQNLECSKNHNQITELIDNILNEKHCPICYEKRTNLSKYCLKCNYMFGQKFKK